MEASNNPQLCAAFQERYAKGEAIKPLRIELGIPQSTAYLWAKEIKQNAADCLRARGFDEGWLAGAYIRQAKTARGHVLRGILREMGEILDIYPAKKPPAPTAPPVTVIFNTNIEQFKEHRYAAHEVGFTRSLPQQSQGNAASGASESSVTGGRVLDTEKSGEQTKA